MSVAADALLKAALDRELIPEGTKVLSREQAFELVREMPYRRASDRDPLTTIREWRGTCSGKHYLLKAVLAELGLATDLIACTTYVRADPALLPEYLAEICNEGPVPDVHNFLRAPWIIDATWPLTAGSYGIPVNPRFEEGRDMSLPCEPIREFLVPDDVDAQAFKDALLAEHFEADELERRSRFFSALAG